MKKIDDIIFNTMDAESDGLGSVYSYQEVFDAMIKLHKNTWNEALKAAVESVELDEVTKTSTFEFDDCNTMENDMGDVYAINSDSILKLKIK